MFCIAEEVLSRGISQFISSQNMRPMVGPKIISFPSHVLYADDIFVFCRANKSTLTNLMKLLSASGQWWISLRVFTFLLMILLPLIGVKCILGCNRGFIPFNYLWVPTFVGAPKSHFLQPLANKVRLKLTSWKGKTLSMMDRIQLVNSVITGFLSYSFQVYKWPANLLKEVDKWLKFYMDCWC